MAGVGEESEGPKSMSSSGFVDGTVAVLLELRKSRMFVGEVKSLVPVDGSSRILKRSTWKKVRIESGRGTTVAYHGFIW